MPENTRLPLLNLDKITWDSKPHCPAEDLSYKIEGDSVRILSYRGTNPILILPPELDGLPVKTIERGAFRENPILQCVIVPDSVTLIRREAFFGCRNLRKVILPINLNAIWTSCFENCVSLREIYLPYALQKIAWGAFRNCTKLSRMIHFSETVTGIIRRNILAYELPSALCVIGKFAFANCAAIKSVMIPANVTELQESCFSGCASLEYVGLHGRLATIENRVFQNCGALREIRIPRSVKTIGADAFQNSSVIIVCEKNSAVSDYASQNAILMRHISTEGADLDSRMIPGNPGEYVPYYTEEQAGKIQEHYEIRPPFREKIRRERRPPQITPSRYRLRDGVYERKAGQDHAIIHMVGDLMCKGASQSFAWKNGEYRFDEAFDRVRAILRKSDLAIANMETMLSPSYPYAQDYVYTLDRPYLNAPEEFAAAIRNAGFDAVINAQNHIYDTGVYGLLETLEVLNRHQLMHTGAFASQNDRRFLLLNVNGIRVGILAWMDGRRQAMKKPDFTFQGRKVLLSIYEPDKVRAEIQTAREAGAEFIIAYCHWGKEYAEFATEYQRAMAEVVANAGADYIFGSHSHCLQPYERIQTAEGGSVPVIFSGGNFFSDMNLNVHISKDTIIASVELGRDENGRVVIQSEGYYPCKIIRDASIRGEYATIPTWLDDLSEEQSALLQAGERHIESVMGPRYRKLTQEKRKKQEDMNQHEYQ